MTMERWKPRRELSVWRPLQDVEEMQRRFEEIFGAPLLSTWRRLPEIERQWLPSVDVFEKDGKIMVKAELPGMKKEDIDVSVVGDTLTIKGEKKTESEVKEEDYYRSERTYGSFFRSLPLPADVDADKIEASYDNGVLEVSLPKVPKAQPKKVPVSAKKEGS